MKKEIIISPEPGWLLSAISTVSITTKRVHLYIRTSQHLDPLCMSQGSTLSSLLPALKLWVMQHLLGGNS